MADFVHEILKIRSGEACSGLSHLFEVHIVSQGFAFGNELSGSPRGL